jgi:hypothetical protein
MNCLRQEISLRDHGITQGGTVLCVNADPDDMRADAKVAAESR